MNTYIINSKKFLCPLQLSLYVVSGRWKGLIVWFLLEESQLRFNQIKKKICEVEKVSDKMLIQSLRDLESFGIIERKVYPVVPPKVEYKLSELGKTLKPIIIELEKFGMQFEK
jgi:DNA-binding HxlR family transcriptional regulator